jgi:hypothetical protein|tara:strand:+ start:1431 stop:2012 length:582 start_codon:yes stop_codon:yes gene_type:complete
MYTKSKLNHFEIATEIYEYMRYEYKFVCHKGMELDKCITTLSNKLVRLKDHQVLQWHLTLNEIAKTHSDRAPTPAEIIRAIVKRSNSIAIEKHPEVKQQNEVDKPYVDYEELWNSANDKGKFRFFIDHKFNEVPPYIHYWFIKYNKKYRGWTAHESNKMIGFWKTPFVGAQSGAMYNYQMEILTYFRERTKDK